MQQDLDLAKAGATQDLTITIAAGFIVATEQTAAE